MKGVHPTLLAVTGMSILLGTLGCALEPTRHVARYKGEPETQKSAFSSLPEGSTVLQVTSEATAPADPTATPDAIAHDSPTGTQKVEPEPLPGNTDSSESLPPPSRPRLLVESRLQTTGTRETAAADQFETPKRVPDRAAPVTLHMDDMEVRKALELLSREANFNILVSPGVTGRVTADLRDVTPDVALEAILKLCKLVSRRANGIIYVYAPEEQGERAVRTYRLNYITSTDLEKMIKPFLSEKGKMSSTPPSEVGIKSDQDQAGGDTLAGGDVIVIEDYEPVLETIERLIKQLDVQPVQILIEAVILSVKSENVKDLGVNFAVLDGAGKVLNLVGNGADINNAAGFNPAQLLTAGTPVVAGVAGVPAIAGVAGGAMGKLVGTAGAATGPLAENSHGLKFGFVDNNVTGFVRALETVGQTEILASPRLLVLNKQRAELQLGRRLGYKTLSQSQVSTVEKVEFLNVGTQLRLRPFVASDGMIRMEVHPERSSGEIINNIPQTSTSEVTTNVMVPDGATIVIGGLMENEDSSFQAGVPGLSKLPAIGPLFRQKRKSQTRTELIVLLTPHIWNPNAPPETNPRYDPAEESKREAGPSARSPN